MEVTDYVPIVFHIDPQMQNAVNVVDVEAVGDVLHKCLVVAVDDKLVELVARLVLYNTAVKAGQKCRKGGVVKAIAEKCKMGDPAC